MSRRTTMSKTFNTLGNDTADVFFFFFRPPGFQTYGNCRGRSSTPFRDYADRDLGRPSFLRIHCLLACRAKSRSAGSWASDWVTLADFYGFMCEVEHPSKAEDVKRVLNLLASCCLFAFLRLPQKRVAQLLTGDVSIGC